MRVVVGDWLLKNICFIYGNHSRPFWLHQNEKNPLYSYPAEQAVIMQQPWISATSRRRIWRDFVSHWICTYRWNIRHLPVQEKTAWHWLLWSQWQGNELCTCDTSIIPLVSPTCCAVGFPSNHPPTPQEKTRGKTLSKQCWDAGLHQPGTLHVSCNAVARTENPSARAVAAQHCKLLSLVNWNYFSLLTSVLAFHLVRKLNLRCSSLPVFSHAVNPQTRLNRQHPRRNPAVQQMIFLHNHPTPPPPPSQLRDRLLIINNHEAEQSHSDIWRETKGALLKCSYV